MKENPQITNDESKQDPMPSEVKTFSDEIKYYESAKADDPQDDRTVTAIISSDRLDRDGEILLPKGAITDEYQKNPVVLWNHDAYSLPVGKTVWIKRKGNQLLAKIKFAATDLGETIWQLFKGGFLNAFSIRFRPLEGRQPTPDDIKSNPSWKTARFVFTKWELLEASPVTIPANPDALAIAVKSKSFKDNDRVAKMFQIDLEDEEILFEIKESEVPPVKNRQVETEDVVEHFVEETEIYPIGRAIDAVIGKQR